MVQAHKFNREDAMDRSRWKKLDDDQDGWVGECFFWYRTKGYKTVVVVVVVDSVVINRLQIDHCCLTHSHSLSANASILWSSTNGKAHSSRMFQFAWCPWKHFMVSSVEELLHFAWVVDDAKCIVVTLVCVCVCVCVCLSVCLSDCPRSYARTTARTRM